MKKIGIYYITNTRDGAVYIGSSVDLVRRWPIHKYYLRNNKHPNPHLQHAWNKYSEEVFTYTIVEECTREELYIREQYHLDAAWNTSGSAVYNMTMVAHKPPMTEDGKRRKSAKMMGNTHTFGRVRPADECARISAGNKGKVRTPEHRERYRQAAVKREAGKKLTGYFAPPWIVANA